MLDIQNLDLFNFLNNIASGFIIVSSNTLFIKFINKTALNILEIKIPPIDRKIKEIINNDKLISSINATIAEKKSFARIVIKISVKSGELYLGFTTSPYIDESGNLLGVVINFRDLTNEIQLESRLKYSELKYKLLIQNLLSPVFIIGYNDYSIIEFNKIAQRKFNIQQPNQPLVNFIELLAADSKPKFSEYLENLKKNKSVDDGIEIQMADAVGENSVFDATAAIFEINAEKFIQIICFDITEKIILQNDLLESYNTLKATQELMIRAERLAAVGELSAGISHEIKNRFQVIANAASYLKLKIPQSDEALTANIRFIENEVNRGVKLINDLMEFARPHPPQKN